MRGAWRTGRTMERTEARDAVTNTVTGHAGEGDPAMRRSPLRTLARVAAITFAAALATACETDEPVSPLPAQTQGASPSRAPVSPAPSTVPRASRTSSPADPAPSAVATPRPTGSFTPSVAASTCQGAVVFTVDAAEVGPPWKAPCLGVGAMVRVENLGPGGLAEDPADMVSCFYEAGVHECRLLHSGTVRFTMTGDEQTRALTVVVR
jgi:hypothetical protein